MKLHNNKDPHYEKISYYVILTSIAIFILYRLSALSDSSRKVDPFDCCSLLPPAVGPPSLQVAPRASA